MAKSKTLEVKAERRSALGTSAARRLRRSGMVPAVLYGRGTDAVNLSLSAETVALVVHHPGMMELRIEGGESTNAIVKELERDALKDSIRHIDFLVVKADEVIQSSVLIEPRGEPAGTAHGGQLEQSLHELEIECLPGDLPEAIEVDVRSLELDDTMDVGDLILPEGIKAVSDPGLAVFQVRLPRVEALDEEEEVAEGEAAEEGDQEDAEDGGDDGKE